jgi:hypothetical protein
VLQKARTGRADIEFEKDHFQFVMTIHGVPCNPSKSHPIFDYPGTTKNDNINAAHTLGLRDKLSQDSTHVRRIASQSVNGPGFDVCIAHAPDEQFVRNLAGSVVGDFLHSSESGLIVPSPGEKKPNSPIGWPGEFIFQSLCPSRRSGLKHYPETGPTDGTSGFNRLISTEITGYENTA